MAFIAVIQVVGVCQVIITLLIGFIEVQGHFVKSDWQLLVFSYSLLLHQFVHAIKRLKLGAELVFCWI